MNLSHLILSLYLVVRSGGEGGSIMEFFFLTIHFSGQRVDNRDSRIQRSDALNYQPFFLSNMEKLSYHLIFFICPLTVKLNNISAKDENFSKMRESKKGSSSHPISIFYSFQLRGDMFRGSPSFYQQYRHCTIHLHVLS